MLLLTFCAVAPNATVRSNAHRLNVEPLTGFALLSEAEQMRALVELLGANGYTQVGGVGWRYLEPVELWGIAFTLTGEATAEVVGWYMHKGVPVTVESLQQAQQLQQLLGVGHPQVRQRLTCVWHT